MSIRRHAQQLVLDPRITLYDIDLTGIGGGTYHFTPMNQFLPYSRSLKISVDPGERGGVRHKFNDELGTDSDVYVKLLFRKKSSSQKVKLRFFRDTGSD